MTDATLIIQSLLAVDPIRQPVMRSVIQALHLPPGSRGLDAGCGIGLQSLLLAEAVGPKGHITGVDILPELLSHAGILVGETGYSERITFREADINQLPFPDSSFDWAWSVDCAGYPAGDLCLLYPYNVPWNGPFRINCPNSEVQSSCPIRY